MTTRLMVFATPHDGMDDEYNRWYTEVHIPDMLAIPGVVSAERHQLVRGAPDEMRYLSVFVLDAEPSAVLAEIGARAKDGRMTMSASADPARTRITVWDSL
ncbi:hypothetical protein AB0I35_16335 [Nocardia sp. NPDC050378]|uniref:hypothetical protein n=1 Tax=Nocardia sp. NPDC050378 TaxID=3155400 RepID=UPI0033E71A8D